MSNDRFDRRTKAYLAWREDAGSVGETLPSSTVYFNGYDAGANNETAALQAQLAEARATLERVRQTIRDAKGDEFFHLVDDLNEVLK